MRKFTILTAIICFAIPSLGQNGEEENIKKVVFAETDSYFKRDAQGWMATWMHDTQARRTFTSTNGGYSTTVGWDSVRAEQERDFKQNANVVPIRIKTDNYTTRTNGNMAWVDYDQVLTDPTSNAATGTARSHEYRMLVKENDQWKILAQITTDVSDVSGSEAIENSLNTIGYRLLASQKINEAIEVFKLNVKLSPDSWNVYDSLGEAYALAGNKKQAIENYEKSIKINPKSTGGMQALAILKGK